jgi:hypothetical protein
MSEPDRLTGTETLNEPRTRNWLLVIEGDIEPLLIGPLDVDELFASAREHRASDPSEEDGLHVLSMDAEGNLCVEAFTHGELAPQE